MTNERQKFDFSTEQEIPQITKPLLQDYLHLADQKLPQLFNSFYLEGSIALGTFNEKFSDIDFICDLNRQPSEDEIRTLKEIHSLIEHKYPERQLSGYFVSFNPEKFESYLRYHDKVLRKHTSFELNSVEGWILKNHGMTLLGTKPENLDFEVDWEVLLRDMKVNLNTYWARWTTSPLYLARLLFDEGIQWATLGVLRQFYTFRENSITSKIEAGNYGLKTVPGKYHSIINEAIAIRSGSTSKFSSRIFRMIVTVKFLKYIIQEINENFQSE